MDYSKFSKKHLIHHWYYYLAGAGILALNKIRHELRGYLTSRPFSALELDKVINYDLEVVTSWLTELKNYDHSDAVANLNILELGPGSDLGVALNFLSLGANEYFALDKFPLIDQAPNALYQKLIDKISKNETQKKYLQQEVALFAKNQSGKIHYVQDQNFSLKHFLDKKIDLVVSQAAFEHFDNPAQVIKEIGQISQSGTKVVAQIDMMTHSRWIKNVDPLNIYRYGDFYYQHTKFAGSPNRWRPDEYVAEFKKAGFKNIKIVPMSTLPLDYISDITSHLYQKFRPKEKQMEILDCYLLATKE
jgi:SAM-dependent methyltransferase